MDTYANLKTAIEAWSNRADLTSLTDDFLDIAESEANKRLKIRAMETRATASLPTSDRYLALPTGFQQMRHLTVNVDPRRDLEYLPPEVITEYGHTTAGKVYYYTVTSQIEFERTPASADTVEMLYYKKFDALDVSNTTNWLTDNAPEVLLYGALWALFLYTMNDVQAQKYQMMFDQAIQVLNKSDNRARYGTAPRVVREIQVP